MESQLTSVSIPSSTSSVSRQCILAINAGSSSLKVAVFAAVILPQRIVSVKVERIGSPEVFLTATFEGQPPHCQSMKDVSHENILDEVMKCLHAQFETTALIGVGHRIVHGGPRYAASQVVSMAMLDKLRKLETMDPEHLPEQVRIIEDLMQRLPDIPHVACFDTAFHHNLPTVARRLPVPRRFDAIGVRRYGFHGLSFAYLMDELGRIDPMGAKGRVVLLHLGNGASLAAVADGRCIDTSMSLTPSSGIPMSTRAGDLDPGLVDYLARAASLTVDQFNRIVHLESGLLGISETTADMQRLLELELTDFRAAEAVEIFCYHVRKWIGAYAAALGGIDTLVFSGGIGERAYEVRRRICNGLGFIGIELDTRRNSENATLISSGLKPVKVRVLATDEEQMIAREVLEVTALATIGEQ